MIGCQQPGTNERDHRLKDSDICRVRFAALFGVHRFVERPLCAGGGRSPEVQF